MFKAPRKLIEAMGSVRRRTAAFARQEQGAILVLAAAGIFGAAALAGLALDFGKVAQDRRDVQNGVDAAALAGAQKLLAGGSTSQVIAAVNEAMKGIPADPANLLDAVFKKVTA